nr:hypothetical protein [Tanacetum cinerariifolium]
AQNGGDVWGSDGEWSLAVLVSGGGVKKQENGAFGLGGKTGEQCYCIVVQRDDGDGGTVRGFYMFSPWVRQGLTCLNPLYMIKECSSCGALYTTDYCGSNGSLVDKIICDLNKAPDSPHLHTFSSNQRHCFQCKDVLGDGEFCQRCTCMRRGSGLSKGLCFICGNNQNPLNDSPSISKNSSQSPPHINHHCCYECGDSLDGIFCKRCTCKSCGKGAHIGYNCPPKVPKLPVIDQTPLEESMKNLRIAFQAWSKNIQQKKKEEEKQIAEEQAAKARYLKTPICYDNNENYTIAIIPKEPDNSLSMGDEHLDTIPAMESDEFIKSSVENLVPNSSESEGEHECDVPACNAFTTFSNLLFDADNESFSDVDILKKIYSNLLFDEKIISIKIDLHHFNAKSDLIESLLNHDSSIISSSSKIDSLLDEFTGELIPLKKIPPGIDETDYDPKEEIQIDLSFTPDDSMPPGIEEDDYDPERDMLIFEELLSNDSFSLPKNESFHFDILSSSRPPTKPPDDDLGILTVKMVDDISELYVPMLRLLPTQTTLVSNQEKYPQFLSHRGFKASQLCAESPMMIYGGNTPNLDVLFLYFYPP